MSGYILCQTKKADVPYFIENISTNIYSLEELCYYLYHNLYLIDQTIINEGLCSWISKELNLPELAAKLRPNLGKFASAEDILYPIFKEINYLSYEELRDLTTELLKLDAQDSAVRDKRKGDSLVENGMYVNAIRVYQKLLEREHLDQVKEGLTRSVYHNLGCAYSYLFQMEKALDYFWKAYECSNSPEDLTTYLLAFGSVRTPKEYEKKAKELGVGEKVLKSIKEEIGKFSGIPERNIETDQVDKMLEELTKEYHRSTGA